MSKTAIAGWVICAVGTALWIYGYYSTGYPSLIDWHARTPWWIADFMPNLESEVGMALIVASMLPIYWPPRR
jgi:hypothetical protein